MGAFDSQRRNGKATFGAMVLKIIWVSLPYATYGIEVENGKVIDAAPIARWMIGKDTRFIREWIAAKGGVWKVLT